MASDVSDPSSIPYATPAPRHGARTWACTAILFSGVALIALGGCFLIGVLCIVRPALIFGQQQSGPVTLNGFDYALMIVLYLLAAASFAGATTLLIIGTRAMLRIVGAKSSSPSSQ